MEIEKKVPLTAQDFERVTNALRALPVTFGTHTQQVDRYYMEAGFRSHEHGAGSWIIRVRTENGTSSLTMKTLTGLGGVWDERETRVENPDVVEHILTTIGVEKAADIRKARQTGRYGTIEINLDDVAGLGKFLEVSIETDGDDARQIQQAQRELDRLLDTLTIDKENVELRGYPAIVLENKGVRFFGSDDS